MRLGLWRWVGRFRIRKPREAISDTTAQMGQESLGDIRGFSGIRTPLMSDTTAHEWGTRHRLEDLEVDVDGDFYFDWFAVFGGWFEFVLTDGFDGFFVETHAYSAGDLDV